MHIYDEVKQFIPSSLLKKGRELTGIGLNEVAWLKKDALTLLKALEGSKIVILGGDVYRDIGDKLVPTYDNWYCDPESVENEIDYAYRSRQKTTDYISSYQEKDDIGRIWYVLVFGNPLKNYTNSGNGYESV